jgi:tight adherence protein C
MELAIGALAFVAVALASWAALHPRENLVVRRIQYGSSASTTIEQRPGESVGQRLLGPSLARVGRILVDLLPSRLLARIDRMLTMADSRLSLAQFVGLWAGSVVLGGALFVYLSQMRMRMTPLQLVLVLLVAIFVFGVGPYILLRGRVKRRQQAITRGLPYALDLLVTCVEAGLGVDAAIAAVTEKTTGPIAEIFAGYLREVGLGRTRREALAQVAERSGVPDLIALAASIAQAEQMGVTIGDALRLQARELRITHRQRVEAAAQRAPVLMTIPLAICFMPAMIAVTAVPAILHLMRYVGNLGSLTR